jgi:hypothetical protein
MPLERRANRPIQNDIAIGARARGETGVKITPNRTDPGNGNIGRKVAVNSQQPGAQRSLSSTIKMHNLTDSMDACIGATRSRALCRLVSDYRNSNVERLLDTGCMRLDLPTIVGRSIILNT